MLVYLRVKNFALVEDISIEPDSGCNVITGETGAGKSILIGALGLVLGLRGDKNLIRSGADQAVVEAVFDISQVSAPIPAFLDSEGIEPCEDGLLRIKRSLCTTASNRQFVNGTPVSVSVLSSLGDWLVDIHGPHDHQSLLYPPDRWKFWIHSENLKLTTLRFSKTTQRLTRIYVLMSSGEKNS
jgi:DNA repair protein RecN (Recombination protein N)